MQNFFIKLISIILALGISMFGFPIAKAQVFGAVPTTETPGPLLSAAAATAAATASTAVGVGVPLTGSLVSVADCSVLIIAVQKFDTAKAETNWLSSLTFGLVGEDEFEAVKIEAEQKVVGAAKECVDDYLIALTKIPVPSLIVGQELQRKQDEYTKLSNSYSERIEQLTARQSLTVKSILRAVLLRVLQNVEKDLTTRVVNGLIEKFKISNYLQYANALGGEVYSMDYIRQNYDGDSRNQLMLRSILQDRYISKGVNQGVVATAFAYQKAEDFLGYDFQNVNLSDPDFYSKLSRSFSPEANPAIQKQNAVDEASSAYTSGLSNANLEIANGKGFIPPRDCSGSIADQQSIDQQTLDVSREVLAARQVYTLLLNSKPRPDQQEIQKARDELELAEQKLREIPNQVSEPIIEICKSIVNPGGAVADQINSFLAKHLNASSEFKPENLPFFATFLSDVASNFITNVITGGRGDGQLLKETGLSHLDSSFASGIDSTTPNLPNAPSYGDTGSGGQNNDGGNDGGQNGDGGSGDTGDGGTGDDGSGGGTATPASCVQENLATDDGITLTCDSLPTGPGINFIINVNFGNLPSGYNALSIGASKLVNGVVYPLEQNVSVAEFDEDGDKIIQYEVEGGINSATRFLFSIDGIISNSQSVFGRTAAINVSPPGQVQGVFFRKLFLRSKTPSALLTSPRGLKLSLR